MGSVVFEPRALPDNMAEVAGFKVGLRTYDFLLPHV